MMDKIKWICLATFPVIIYILLFWLAYDLKKALPEDKPITTEPQIVQVVARGFCEYGHDRAGNAYGPGYVIVSAYGFIPLGANLDVDLFGQCQAVSSTTDLASNEIKVWMQSPSEVAAVGYQEAWVQVLEKGEIVK